MAVMKSVKAATLCKLSIRHLHLSYRVSKQLPAKHGISSVPFPKYERNYEEPSERHSQRDRYRTVWTAHVRVTIMGRY
jgi:hypothetical protein